MTETREKLEHTRQLLANCKRRGEQLVSSAESYRDWPTNCDTKTMLFAVELAITALDLVERGAAALGMHSESLDVPISEAAVAEFAADSAEDRAAGLTAGDRLTVRFALARRLAASATDLIEHAEGTLESKETLDGEPIHRGPLYDK